MATIANGTGKRRALKKTENNDKNRTSIDDTAVSKEAAEEMDAVFKKEFEEIIGCLELLSAKERLIPNKWLKKLKRANDETEDLKNWREIRNEYTSLMCNQLRRSEIIDPFLNRPPPGPLRPVPKKLAYTKMKFTLVSDDVEDS